LIGLGFGGAAALTRGQIIAARGEALTERALGTRFRPGELQTTILERERVPIVFIEGSKRKRFVGGEVIEELEGVAGILKKDKRFLVSGRGERKISTFVESIDVAGPLGKPTTFRTTQEFDIKGDLFPIRKSPLETLTIGRVSTDEGIRGVSGLTTRVGRDEFVTVSGDLRRLGINTERPVARRGGISIQEILQKPEILVDINRGDITITKLIKGARSRTTVEVGELPGGVRPRARLTQELTQEQVGLVPQFIIQQPQKVKLAPSQSAPSQLVPSQVVSSQVPDFGALAPRGTVFFGRRSQFEQQDQQFTLSSALPPIGGQRDIKLPTLVPQQEITQTPFQPSALSPIGGQDLRTRTGVSPKAPTIFERQRDIKLPTLVPQQEITQTPFQPFALSSPSALSSIGGQDSRTITRVSPISAVAPKSIGRQRDIQLSATRLKQPQVSATATKQLQAPIAPLQALPVRLGTPFRFGFRGFLPLPILPSGIKTFKRKPLRIERTFFRTPSFAAAQLGIEAEAPLALEFTGLIERPLIRKRKRRKK